MTTVILIAAGLLAIAVFSLLRRFLRRAPRCSFCKQKLEGQRYAGVKLNYCSPECASKARVQMARRLEDNEETKQ